MKSVSAKKRILVVMKDVAAYDPYFLTAYQAIYEMSSKQVDIMMANLQADPETLRLMVNAHDTFKYGSPKAIEETRARMRRLFQRAIARAGAAA